jgi:molecular chaperone HtpG
MPRHSSLESRRVQHSRSSSGGLIRLMGTTGRFRLHLPGLLKVLAEHLYSTQRVGVRELIQNAHDSCVRRLMERQESGYRARIDISIDPANRMLRVADNGSGLTESEIENYLTVIGRGYTRELRERLAIGDPAGSQELIGQFGIGFLSAFLLASEVTVSTRPEGGPALRWSSTGDEEFALEPGDRPETGTTVELRLKPSALFLLHEQNLVDVIQEYADFVPTPIHVQGLPDEVNLRTYPWDQSDVEAACRSYAQRRFGEVGPLWILPLTDGIIDLGHDTITVPLRGFLFVPSASVASIKEYGSVAVSIRGMAICDADKDLLPAWARFVRGIIDAPSLQPTASREAVHQDESFQAVRRLLAAQLGAGLDDLARKSPEVWRRIVHGHSDVIMGWAAKDASFFRMVAESVPLRTTRGRLPLPTYLKATGNVAYFTTRELGSLQDKVLAEARDVPAIDASWFAVPAFLDGYAALHPEVKLVRLDDDLQALLRPVPTGDFGELIRLCEELGFSVEVSSFKPADFPAVMTYPAGAETLRDVSSSIAEGLFPVGFSGLMKGFVDERRTAPSDDRGTLHLNATCPLIRRLAASEVAPARKQAAMAVIAHFARLFCGRMLDASQATSDLGAWQRSLDHLVSP